MNKLFWIGEGRGGAGHAVDPAVPALSICGERVEIETDHHSDPCIVDNVQEDLTCTPCRLLVAESNGDEDATELLDWASDKARASEAADAMTDHHGRATQERTGDNSNVARHKRTMEHLAKALRSIDYDDPEDGSEALAEWVAYELGFEAADSRWEPLFHENNWLIQGIRYTLGGVTVELKVALNNVAEGH